MFRLIKSLSEVIWNVVDAEIIKFYRCLFFTLDKQNFWSLIFD